MGPPEHVRHWRPEREPLHALQPDVSGQLQGQHPLEIWGCSPAFETGSVGRTLGAGSQPHGVISSVMFTLHSKSASPALHIIFMSESGARAPVNSNLNFD